MNAEPLDSMKYHAELDATGLMCPLPLLKLKQSLRSLESQQVVRVLATDPASVLDFGVFVEQAGHSLVERTETDGILCFLIRKG